MQNIKVKIAKMNILSIILFFVTSIIFVLIQLKLYQYIYIDVDFLIVLITILIPIMHELLHFIGFIIFAKLKPNQLIFKSNKSSPIPYFKTTHALGKNEYILVLLLLCITLTCLSIYLSLKDNNILFSIIVGYSLSIGTGDLMLIKEFLKLSAKDEIISIEDEIGFTVLTNTYKDL